MSDPAAAGKNYFRTICIVSAFFVLSLSAACLQDREKLPAHLYLRLDTNPTTLDPALIVDVTGGSIAAKLFNGLVRLDENFRIRPDLAESWEVSEDGRVYSFTLKEGVTFTNGRKVDASDIKYSFERLLRPGTRSPNTWVLAHIQGSGDVMQGRRRHLEGLSVRSERQITITLSEPFAPFLSLLSMTAAYTVPREVVERQGEDFGALPAGSGPYRIVEWLPDQFLRLEARQDYFAGQAPVKGIVYKIIPEHLTAVAEFETGQIDVMSVPSAEFRRYRDSSRWKPLMTGASGINTYYLGFNCDREPFDNPLLRKAVSHAIDRKKILETIYENRGVLSAGPVPPALRNWPPAETVPYDPDRARRLLKEAGHPGGLNVRIYLTSDNEVLDILEVLQAYLARVGIEAELRQLEWSAYKAAINRGEPDAFWLSWWADYPDPENFLFPLFHSSNFGAGGNRTRYRNPEVDALIEAGQRSMNGRLRTALFEAAEKMIVRDSPWVFFWHRREFTVRQPWVKNYRLYPIYSMDKGMEVALRKTP